MTYVLNNCLCSYWQLFIILFYLMLARIILLTYTKLVGINLCYTNSSLCTLQCACLCACRHSAGA